MGVTEYFRIKLVFNFYFGFRNIFLQKKYYQKRFTNSAIGLPSSKNTIIYINNVPIKDVKDNNDSDSDVVMVNDNINIDRDIIVISDDDESLAETRTVNDVKGMETDCDSKDISIDLSNESTHSFNVLENYLKPSSSFDKCISELEHVIKVEVQENSQEIFFDNLLKESIIKNEVNNNVDNNDLYLTYLKDINNDFDITKCDEKNLDINIELSHEKHNVTLRNDIPIDFDIDIKLSGVNKNTKVISPDSDVNKDLDMTLSLCSSKRSRSDSEDSDVMNKKYKGSIIKYVSIVPENSDDKITIDLVRKVQAVISTTIDEASFLPLLQCHGIKNDKLVYSCHNEKTYLWLKKVISAASELKVKIGDVEFESEKYYKMKLKINSFIDESLKVFLNRIELYNAGLVTDKWKLINRQIFRNCIIMTLWVDRESYQYICDSKFSLFAGVDKVQFCICFWIT